MGGSEWGPGTIFPDLSKVFDAPAGFICKQRYNITPPSGSDLQEKYHFTNQDVWNATRIIFTVGEIDPVSALAPLQLLGRINTDRNVARTVMVSGGGHCEDMDAPRGQMKDGVERAQNIVLQSIIEWLGVTRQDEAGRSEQPLLR